ncbi:hypothetical protein EMIT0P201_30245 [Pseudomonas chlororaphis]
MCQAERFAGKPRAYRSPRDACPSPARALLSIMASHSFALHRIRHAHRCQVAETSQLSGSAGPAENLPRCPALAVRAAAR